MRNLLTERESLSVLKLLAPSAVEQERLTSLDRSKQLPAEPVKALVKYKVRDLL
jgi:hypothetical protein